MQTPEGQRDILNHRDGDSDEAKLMPRYQEDPADIGTANDKGTTACSVLISDNRVFCANIGDSRAVIAERAKTIKPKKEKKEKNKTKDEQQEDEVEIF